MVNKFCHASFKESPQDFSPNDCACVKSLKLEV